MEKEEKYGKYLQNLRNSVKMFGGVVGNEYFCKKEKNKAMSKEELRSYRLTSMEEPTDEMLEAIMMGVQETARRTTENARKELDRRFEKMKREIASYRASQLCVMS